MTWGCVLLRDDVHVRYRCDSGEHLSSRSEELGSWSGAKQLLSGAGGGESGVCPPPAVARWAAYPLSASVSSPVEQGLRAPSPKRWALCRARRSTRGQRGRIQRASCRCNLFFVGKPLGSLGIKRSLEKIKYRSTVPTRDFH